MEGWAIFLFALPASCDVVGTTLMNAGLLYLPVSIYQMTRGSLVLFVAILSVLFLKRRLALHQWMSLAVVVGGVGLVGFAGTLNGPEGGGQVVLRDWVKDEEVGKGLIGISLILIAQIL